MIELQNVCKSFEGREVLKHISITFETGKTNLIIGLSGSGKTVLLKSIIGLHNIDSGKIFYDSREFSSMNSLQKKEIRQEMGMVFQAGALFDSLTVEQNVMFPLEMFTNFSQKERKERADFCLNRVNLSKNAYSLFPSEISGGMQKRTAIARAIVLNPKYLFCDEPNSGLDPQTSIVIDSLIYELTAEFHITTIINTHDMNSVLEIGDKILFIYKGEKSWEGSKNEILTAENSYIEEFLFASSLMKKIKNRF